MGGQCPLCERPKESSSELCSLHNTALANLDNAYLSWNRAYGGSLTKEGYFTKLATLSETGRAVKDVVRYLQGKGVAD